MIKEFQGQYRWLSNFAPVQIRLGDYLYPSVEHAYMSAKSDAVDWKEFCATPANTAGTVKRRSREVLLVDDWEGKKVEVMAECLGQKFRQQPYKDKLLATKDMLIQEGNTWGDRFWGVDLRANPPKGQNMLGQLIMRVRAELREEV